MNKLLFERDGAPVAGALRARFAVAGDPDSPDISELARSGADVLELGVPFSDPVAEAPDVQEANLRALSAGTSLEDVFTLVLRARETSDIPVVLYTYFNPVFRYGTERFFMRCAECGVMGAAFADLPFEEREEASEPARRHGVSLIMSIATADRHRAKQIAECGEGYLRVQPVGGEAARTDVIVALGGIPYVILG